MSSKRRCVAASAAVASAARTAVRIPLCSRAAGLPTSGFSLGGVAAALVYAWVVPSHGRCRLFHIGLLPVVVAPWVRRAW